MKITSSIVRGSFEFCDASGNLLKEIPYIVNISRVADEVTKRRAELLKAQQAADFEQIGAAVIQLLAAIFGEKTTKELFDFCAEDYVALMNDTLPVVATEILPAVEQARKQMIETKKLIKDA